MADVDILSAAVTLLVGFLIFLTLGWKYPAVYAKWKEGKVTRAYGRIGWLLLLTVLTAVVSAGFSLLGSLEVLKFSQGKDLAIIFFIISLGFLSAFACYILQESPSGNNEKN